MVGEGRDWVSNKEALMSKDVLANKWGQFPRCT